MGGLVVKPRARILHGHDWVFSGEVLKVFGSPADGDVISLKDGRDRLARERDLQLQVADCGAAVFAPETGPRSRFFPASNCAGRSNTGRAARSSRDSAASSGARATDFPGVIVDRYGDCLVLQTLTLAMDQRKELIVRALEDYFCRASAPLAERNEAGGAPALQIIERNDAPVRRAEGMELQSGLLRGDAPNEIEIEVAGLKLQIDPLHAQKTGFYLDQLPNYALVAQHAKGTARPRLFRQPGSVRAGLRPRRRARSRRRGSGRGERPRRRTEFGAQSIAGALGRAGCFPVPPRGRESRRNIRPDHPRSAVIHEKQRAACTTPCAATRNCTFALSSCFRLTECWRRFPARITSARKYLRR